MPKHEQSGNAQPLGDNCLSIGIGTTLSGRYARIGTEMKQAAELAIEETNAAGGIGGFRVLSQAADDASDVQMGEAVARQFCGQASLLGVVGHYGSDISIAASGIYAQCGLVMITPIASNPAVTDSGRENVFRFTNRDDYTGSAIAGHLFKKLAKRRAVLVESEYAYGKSMGSAFAKAFQQFGGEIILQHSVTVGEREFGRLISTLPEDFDVLFYGGAFEGAFLLKAMREQGRNQLFATGDGCWDKTNFLEPAGSAATQGEGVLVLAATPEVGRVDGSRGFAERYEQRYGPITNYAVNSYDSTCLLLKAIEFAAQQNAAPPTRTDTLAAMRRIKFQGIAYSRPAEWDSKGDNTAAVTALYIVEGTSFRQIAEIARDGNR